MAQTITISARINAPVEKVWEFFTDPKHIMAWNFASPDWHAPRAENNVVVGGRFVSRMEAKDGSAGFDFGGTYTEVEKNKTLAYTMDGVDRKVHVSFESVEGSTQIEETFDAETENSLERQRQGWQSILDNFKKYVESN